MMSGVPLGTTCSAACATASQSSPAPACTAAQPAPLPSLHRCLERHGISRLPESPDKSAKRGTFAETAIGYAPIDISERRLAPDYAAPGKLNMFLAIDRVSKVTPVHRLRRDIDCVEVRADAGKRNGAEFLRGVVAAFPYAIHTMLTDNGMAFADLPKNRNGPSRRYLAAHIFDRVCDEHGIKHKLTKPYHPWTNGQAERMNRTVKDATIKQRCHHQGVPLSCSPLQPAGVENHDPSGGTFQHGLCWAGQEARS